MPKKSSDFFHSPVSADKYLLSIIDGSRKGIVASLLRGTLSLLAFIYAAGLKIYLAPYQFGLRKQTRLPCPVISIGNLTVGGTGKTPMTITVCRALQRHGLRVCILNRGYKGESEHDAVVVSAKRADLTAAETGDEARLLASQLPDAPVIVGKDRRRTGALACEQFQPDIIVLDDGMQFYQLHRDLDLVLVDALRPFGNGWTFPRGLLREPPGHLNRAGCIVITNSDKASGESVKTLEQRIAKLAPGKPLFKASFAPTRLKALDRSHEFSPVWLAGRRIALLSAIGNPESFGAQGVQLGADVVHRADFPDHHEITGGELHQVIDSACAAGAEAIIVTEKDAVKLPPIMRPLPMYALAVEMVIDDEGRFESALLEVTRK